MPLPALDLPRSADVSRDQRLQWERELLGLYLSDHPFKRYASVAANDTTAFCGQIGEDLAGQTVVVAGMVASVRVLTTRQGRPWAAVMLEDLDGAIETIVWSRIYEPTRDLWTEGNVVLLRGKVDQRDDRIQLICEDARLYVPSHQYLDREGDTAAVPVSADDPFAPPLDARPLDPTLVSQPLASPCANGAAWHGGLVINVRPSTDRSADLRLMEQVFAALREFPGEGSVRLVVERPQRVHAFEVPHVVVAQELHQRLTRLLGSDAVHLV